MILDVRMPPTFTDEGIRAAVEARRLHPGLPVLVLSAWVEQSFATQLMADGAHGIGQPGHRRPSGRHRRGGARTHPQHLQQAGPASRPRVRPSCGVGTESSPGDGGGTRRQSSPLRGHLRKNGPKRHTEEAS
nr:hypothetical protein [Luteococcus sp.]